jgi:hypothetical protein
MRAIIVAVLMISLTTHLFSQTKTEEKMNNSSYPFETMERDGQYSIIAQIESAELFSKYNPIFERNGYSGNGYCWEGHIAQILDKVDKGLLNHIEFDPEAGAFFAYADSKSAQQKFIEILSPIFTDLRKLEEYIKSAQRDRIDD